MEPELADEGLGDLPPMRLVSLDVQRRAGGQVLAVQQSGVDPVKTASAFIPAREMIQSRS